jgi:hypothetical protein
MVSGLEAEARRRFSRWRILSFEPKGVLREMAKCRYTDIVEKKVLDVRGS